jgi:hypothetical protein
VKENIKLIQKACDIISDIDMFDDVQCVAILQWDKIPEAARQLACHITVKARVTVYVLNKTYIVDISNLGMFQVI